MKKILSITFVLLSTVFITACSDADKNTETHDDTGQEAGHHTEEKSEKTEVEHDDTGLPENHHDEDVSEDHDDTGMEDGHHDQVEAHDDSNEPPHRH